MSDLQEYDEYAQGGDHEYAEQHAEDAVVTSAMGGYGLELRAMYYIHGVLGERMALIQDDYFVFPQTTWQVTAVEITPFRALDEKYADNAWWGVMDFADQPGGAFAFVDMHAATLISGVGEEDMQEEGGMQQVEQWFQHLAVQFMECWAEIAQFDVQCYPSPTAPAMQELQSMFPGLNMNTPVVTTSFRVSQPGLPQTARVVLGVPQAYLLALGPSLQSIGETTLGGNDTTYFYERFAYVDEVPVPVSVLLGKVELTVGEMQGLEEGDVIELGTMLGEPLDVKVGSLTMRGKPGTTADGRRLAVQIVQTQP